MYERASLESGTHQRVIAEMREAEAAGRRLNTRCVQRAADGTWRPVAPWAGSRQATEAADRRLRLQWAERSLRATGPDAARRRRLRLAQLTLDPATGRALRLAAAERATGWR